MMSLRSVSAWVFALGAVALSTSAGGCVAKSETDPNAGPVYKYPDRVSFCGAEAAAKCSAAVVTACFSAVSTANTQTCVESQAALCNTNTLPYHPQTAEACIAAYTALYATTPWTRTQLDAVEAACINVFSNAGPVGTPCTSDADCNTGAGLACVLRGSSGSCQKPIPTAGGDPCATNPADQCSSTQYCDAMADACLTKKPATSACSADIPCDDSSQCTGGVCVARGTTVTSPCAADTDCATCTTTAGKTVCQVAFCGKATGMPMGTCVSTLALDHYSSNCDPYLGR